MFDVPISMDIPSSSSTSSFVGGSRALDRHNPIVTDEKRSGFSSKPGTPIGTPQTHYILQQKPKTPFSENTRLNSPTSLKKKNKKTSLLKTTKNTSQTTIPKPSYYDPEDDNEENKMGLSETSDMFADKSKNEIASKASNVEEYVSPPESSRYLLDNDTSFLDIFSGFDPVLNLDDPNNKTGKDDSNQIKDSGLGEDLCKAPKPSSSSTVSSDQVVVLRVSLHCRGCERKMKKHLSRMSGVTSFNIDFAAKEVTVIGDVTPLQVLANISKVKTAKLWSPPIPLSSANIHAKDSGTKE